jgi:hypothetical protein
MTGQRKDWFGRNWKWLVPAICLTALLVLGGVVGLMLFGIETMLKESAPYQKAVASAKADPRVMATLGVPITEGWFSTGNVSVNYSSSGGRTGKANMAIPISGPKGKGTIYVAASETAGKWSFSKLVVHVTKTGEEFDLIEPSDKGQRTKRFRARPEVRNICDATARMPQPRGIDNAPGSNVRRESCAAGQPG